MKSTPVKGTADYLPSQTLLRDYMQGVILDTYRAAGFERILTPAIEHMENLEKSDGGDNLNLMFKILKRGEKLEKALAAGDESQLADLGLRYDLTLPLSRFYAANRARLGNPFKCIQIDKSYRAERPQKGRMREFVQCDIDILGSESPLCELELIATTAAALQKLDIGRFTIKLNDRRLLKACLAACGVADEQMDTVCVSLDKWDKIGGEGVMAELAGKGIAEDACAALQKLLDGERTLDAVAAVCGENEVVQRTRKLLADVQVLAAGGYDVEFDLLLVRGQGYYTGTVFEIQSNKFRGSIGGGGRYDGLVGKFTGENVPAVGFSIGFERIFAILQEQGCKIPGRARRIAVLCNEDETVPAMQKAAALRTGGDSVGVYIRPKKLGKLLNRLEEQGFDGYLVYGEGDQPRLFAERQN